MFKIQWLITNNICMYMGWVQIIYGVILNNVKPLNNF